MKSWQILICIVILLYVPSSLFLQAQSNLSAEEVWEYGRGVIYDFDWQGDSLVFPAGGHLWEVNPESNLNPIEQTANFISLSLSPDGTRMVTQGQDEILIRDVGTDAIVSRIPRHYVVRTDAAWLPGTNLLAVRGPNENQLEVWNTDTGELTDTIGGYATGIKAFKWHPNGEYMAVVLTNNTILIETVTRHEQRRELYTVSTAAGLAWSPDGRFLAVPSDDTSPVKLWQTDTFEAVTLGNAPVFILTLAWNAQSTQLAGPLIDSGVGIWNIETGEVISLGVETDLTIDRLVEQVAWHGDRLAALDRTQRLRAWNVENETLLWDSSKYEFQNLILAFAVRPDGPMAAVGYYRTSELLLLDTETGALQQTLKLPRLLDLSSSMAWSPSGNDLGMSAQNLFIWSLAPEASKDPIEVDDVDNMSWSPDGTVAVTSNDQRILRLVEGKTGTLLKSLDVPNVAFARWSPDGNSLALYRVNPRGDDNTIPPVQIDIWDRESNDIKTLDFSQTNEERLYPSEHFEWRPDSSGLTGSTSRTLWHWTVDASHVEIVALNSAIETTDQVLRVSLNQNGNRLALLTSGTIYILDAESGELLLTLSDFPSEPRYFAWASHDRLLVAYDGVVVAYRIR